MTSEPIKGTAARDGLTPAQWERAKQAFGAVSEMSGDALASFLGALEAEDPVVRAHVESLVGARARAPGFLERAPSVELAAARVDEQVAPGVRVGAYRVLGLLARGGMGAVYEAQQERPCRTVALKIMRPGLTSERGFRRFAIEAEVLGRLQHPGIAQIYEAGLWEDAPGDEVRPFFAMELVRGRVLTEHAGGLGLRARAALLAELCDAVAHAHQRGVVHRDLKPANVLVDNTGRIKVLDFGVARSTDADLRSTIDTQEAQIVGTVPYMSPEQVSGNSADIDVRSDVYSLGVLSYELLVGRRPYDLTDATIVTAARIIREVEPTPPAQVNPGLKGDLEVILLKALAKERQRRYDSAAELGADLRRYLDHRPVVARRPSAAYLARKFVRRHPGLVSGTAGVVLALSAGIVATTVQMQRARRSEARARENADQLREMARTLIGFNISFYNSLGTMKHRQAYIEGALGGLDLLVRSGETDRTAMMELADAYRQFGEVQGFPLSENIGDVSGALASFGKAMEIYRGLGGAESRDVELARLVARIWDRMALTMTSTDRTRETIAAFDQAIVAQCRVLDLAPGAIEPHGGAAYLYWRLNLILGFAGRAAECTTRADDAWALAQRLVLPQSPSLEDLSNAGNALGTYARAVGYAGQLDRAKELLGRAESLLNQAVRGAPENPTFALSAIDIHRFRADAYMGAGDDAHKCEELELLCAGLRAYLRTFPDRWDGTDLLGTSLMRLAVGYQALGRPGDGIALAEEAVTILGSVLEREPKSAAALPKLMHALRGAGLVLASAARDGPGTAQERRAWMERALGRNRAALDAAHQVDALGVLGGQGEDLLGTITREIAECERWLAEGGDKGAG